MLSLLTLCIKSLYAPILIDCVLANGMPSSIPRYGEKILVTFLSLVIHGHGFPLQKKVQNYINKCLILFSGFSKFFGLICVF